MCVTIMLSPLIDRSPPSLSADHTASAHSQHPSAVSYSPYEQGYDQPQAGGGYPPPQQSLSPPPQQPQQGTQYFSPQPNSYYTNEPPAFLAPGLAAQSTSPPPMSNTGYQQQGYNDQPYAGNSHSNYDYGYDQQRQPTRQYTLGGDGYGQSSVPPLQDDGGAYDPYSTQAQVGAVMVGGSGAGNTSPVKGPRAQPPSNYAGAGSGAGGSGYDDSPPGYDPGDGQVQGRWGKQ